MGETGVLYQTKMKQKEEKPSKMKVKKEEMLKCAAEISDDKIND